MRAYLLGCCLTRFCLVGFVCVYVSSVDAFEVPHVSVPLPRINVPAPHVTAPPHIVVPSVRPSTSTRSNIAVPHISPKKETMTNRARTENRRSTLAGHSRWSAHPNVPVITSTNAAPQTSSGSSTEFANVSGYPGVPVGNASNSSSATSAGAPPTTGAALSVNTPAGSSQATTGAQVAGSSRSFTTANDNSARRSHNCGRRRGSPVC
jgi:hypothetical protein